MIVLTVLVVKPVKAQGISKSNSLVNWHRPAKLVQEAKADEVTRIPKQLSEVEPAISSAQMLLVQSPAPNTPLTEVVQVTSVKANPTDKGLEIILQTTVFLFFTGFTGFCWNFYDLTNPIIYAVTFTQKPSEPVSKPIPSKSTLGLTEQLKIADAALPGAVTKSIYFPSKPEEALRINMKLPQESLYDANSNVYLDQYSGDVLRVDNALKMPLGDRVLNFFVPLHYGTFGGLPTRILYVFVGLAPLILFVTGFVMWKHRYRTKSTTGFIKRSVLK